jgi:phosphatidylinositol alpha 1,6-mannosyltransferase
MKILIITPNYPPIVCGIGDYSRQLAKTLCEQGHEVHVLTSSLENVETSAREWDQNIRVYERNTCWRAKEVVADIERLPPVDHILIQYAPTLFHPWGISILFAQLAFRLKRTGKHAHLIAHELFLDISFRSWKRSSISILQRILFLLAYSQVSSLIVTTQARYQSIRKWLPVFSHKIHYVPVGTNISIDSTGNADSQVKREAQQPRRFVAVTLGQLQAGRDYEGMLRAIAHLQKEGIAVQLQCLGYVNRSTPRFHQLTQLSSNLGLAGRVSWHGYLPDEAIRHWMEAADAYLHIYSGGPVSNSSTTLATALGFGVPIIAAHGELPTYPFVHQQNALLFHGTIEDAVYKGIKTLMENKQLMIQLRSNAQELYRTHLSWPSIATAIITILAQDE